MTRLWGGLAGLIGGRYRWIIAVAALATVALAFGLPRIQFRTGQDTLLSLELQGLPG